MSNRQRHLYEFGPFRLDAAEGQLLCAGQEIPLTPKAFQLLHVLVENGGHVLDKDALMGRVWADSFVEEKNLADNISILRKVLGDDPKEPRYIKTVPRRGYRFIAEVREVVEDGGQALLRERERARFVIEEEHDPLTEARADALEVTPRESPPAPARRRLSPALAVAALALATGLALGAYALWKKREAPGAPLARSIAVLPFKPLVAGSADPALELGITDALISKLSNIRQVVVRPTNSVLRYTGEGQDLRMVGSELGVDVILDGRVQKVGERVRLSVQLVRAADGVPIWAEQFDGEFTDIFAVQDEISRKVASKLSLQLTGEESRGLAKRYTENAEAYQLYVKGLYHWRTFETEGLMTSLNFFNAAIEKDPRYALAYAGLANSYNVIAIYGPLPTSEAMEKSREAALKAVELDEALAEARVALGAVRLFGEWDWPGAERELGRALELAPENVDAHELYGYYLQATGRAGEAVGEMRKAAEAAPQWDIPSGDLLESYFIARRYDAAAAHALEMLRLEPGQPSALWVLGRSYMMRGMHDEAVAQFERGLAAVEAQGPESSPRVWLLSGLGYAHARAGRRGEALKVVGRMRESQSRWKALYIALALAGLSDKDQAFAMLDEAYRERLPFLWQVRCLPEFDSLRSDPRYAELLRRLNLQP